MKTKVIEHYIVPDWIGCYEASIVAHLNIPYPNYPFRLIVEEFKTPDNSMTQWIHAYIVEDVN